MPKDPSYLTIVFKVKLALEGHLEAIFEGHFTNENEIIFARSLVESMNNSINCKDY